MHLLLYSEVFATRYPTICSVSVDHKNSQRNRLIVFVNLWEGLAGTIYGRLVSPQTLLRIPPRQDAWREINELSVAD